MAGWPFYGRLDTIVGVTRRECASVSPVIQPTSNHKQSWASSCSPEHSIHRVKEESRLQNWLISPFQK